MARSQRGHQQQITGEHHRGAARRRVSTKIKPALSESCRFGTGNPASPLSTRHQSPSDAEEEEPAPQTHPRRTRRQQSRRPRNALTPAPRSPLWSIRTRGGRSLGHARRTRPALTPDPCPSPRAAAAPGRRRRSPRVPRMIMNHAAAPINCWMYLFTHRMGSRGAGAEGRAWQRRGGTEQVRLCHAGQVKAETNLLIFLCLKKYFFFLSSRSI